MLILLIYGAPREPSRFERYAQSKMVHPHCDRKPHGLMMWHDIIGLVDVALANIFKAGKWPFPFCLEALVVFLCLSRLEGLHVSM